MKIKNFINTNFFKHLDWEEEIIKPIKLETKELKAGSDALGKLTSNATFTWTLAADYLNETTEANEPHEKANVLKMLEYFFARFIVLHSMFYSNIKEVQDDEDMSTYIKRKHVGEELTKMRKFYGKVPKSACPIDKIDAIGKILLKQVKR